MTDVIWVGIDLGTQSVRAVAVEATGTVLSAAARPLTSRRDGNRHEQDPHEWWAKVADALAEMVRGLPDGAAATIGGVAVDGTSGTVLLTDPDGTPRTPGLMYDDSRAGALAAEAQEAGDALWNRLRYRIQPAWALPKLLWWRDEGMLHAGARLAHQADVITANLVGRPVATDTSHALKTGYDLIGLRWPTDVLENLHIEPDVLPPVQLAGSVLGHVGADAAIRTGLPEGVRVIAGMTAAPPSSPRARCRRGNGTRCSGPPSPSRASPTRCCTIRPARCTPTAPRTGTCGCPEAHRAPVRV
jgi:sugar (pentulose or hexulose) kinase